MLCQGNYSGCYNFSVTLRGAQDSESCSLAAVPLVSALCLGFLFSQVCPSLCYLSVTEQVSSPDFLRSLLFLLSHMALLYAPPSLPLSLSLTGQVGFDCPHGVPVIFSVSSSSPMPLCLHFPSWYLTDTFFFLVLHESDESTGFLSRNEDSELKGV